MEYFILSGFLFVVPKSGRRISILGSRGDEWLGDLSCITQRCHQTISQEETQLRQAKGMHLKV